MELVRFCYTAEHTLGWLTVADLRLATIERPWIPSPVHRGGLNRQSCIPDGEYKLGYHSGPRFRDVYILEAEDLDVYREPTTAGRYAILIHAGNFVADVIGCIAPGRAHAILSGRQAVTSSRVAMEQLRVALPSPLPTLTIRPTRGTAEVPGNSIQGTPNGDS